MKKKNGFIGLGIMGRPMAKNLLKAGFSLVVYDLNKEAVEDVVKAGAASAHSSRDVAQSTEVIIIMVPDSPEVKEVILGKDGVLEGVRPGSLVIDMSSINPLVSQEIARELKKKGVDMLDAPVSGGEPGAVQGTLAIMVGGEEKIFKECFKGIMFVLPQGLGLLWLAP
jgi:2-hydroxy-3-oxopropionate reductase